jgi:hypothetical protein
VKTAGHQTSRFGHAEVFAAIAALSFLVALSGARFPYSCLLRALAGIPCATCG